MPVFNTYNPDTASTFQYYTPKPKTDLSSDWGLGLSKEQALSLLGYKTNGELNTFGHVQNGLGIAGVGEGFVAIAARDALAKNIAGNSDASMGIAEHQKKNLGVGLGLAQIGLGAGLIGTGAGVGVGAPLIASGVKQTYNTYQMENGGLIKGGSHESGHDLAIVDKHTGGDTGIRVEGGEMVFSKERTNALKHAYATKDYNAIMKIVREQMINGGGGHKLENGTDELGLLVPQSTSMNWATGYPTATNEGIGSMPIDAGDNMMNWGNGQVYTPTPPNDFNLTNASMDAIKGYSGVPNNGIVTTAPKATDWNSYFKYAIPAAQIGLGAYATQSTKLPEYTRPESFNALMALHKKQSGQGLTAEENMLLDREIQNAYHTGVNKIYNASGGNAGAILGNQNALAGDVLNAKIKQMALNADERKRNTNAYAEDIAKELSLTQDAFNRRYAQAVGARSAGGQLMGTGINNAQDMLIADELAKTQKEQDNTSSKALLDYLKAHNK
jgi:hypothetical protein